MVTVWTRGGEKRGGEEVEKEEEETSIGYFCYFINIIIIIIMKDYFNINNTFIVITMISIKYVHIMNMRIRITYTECYMKACAQRTHRSLAVLWAHSKTSQVFLSASSHINKAGIRYRTRNEVLYKYQLNHTLACIRIRTLV